MGDRSRSSRIGPLTLITRPFVGFPKGDRIGDYRADEMSVISASPLGAPGSRTLPKGKLDGAMSPNRGGAGTWGHLLHSNGAPGAPGINGERAGQPRVGANAKIISKVNLRSDGSPLP